jgi:hypothetical protein
MRPSMHYFMGTTVSAGNSAPTSPSRGFGIVFQGRQTSASGSLSQGGAAASTPGAEEGGGGRAPQSAAKSVPPLAPLDVFLEDLDPTGSVTRPVASGASAPAAVGSAAAAGSGAAARPQSPPGLPPASAGSRAPSDADAAAAAWLRDRAASEAERAALRGLGMGISASEAKLGAEAAALLASPAGVPRSSRHAGVDFASEATPSSGKHQPQLEEPEDEAAAVLRLLRDVLPASASASHQSRTGASSSVISPARTPAPSVTNLFDTSPHHTHGPASASSAVATAAAALQAAASYLSARGAPAQSSPRTTAHAVAGAGAAAAAVSPSLSGRVPWRGGKGVTAPAGPNDPYGLAGPPGTHRHHGHDAEHRPRYRSHSPRSRQAQRQLPDDDPVGHAAKLLAQPLPKATGAAAAAPAGSAWDALLPPQPTAAVHVPGSRIPVLVQRGTVNQYARSDRSPSPSPSAAKKSTSAPHSPVPGPTGSDWIYGNSGRRGK